jgi:proteasome lid subunit RPN8/RPN11
VRLAPELLALIVEHARRDAPDECCGLVGVRDGEAFEVVETANSEASPLRFNIEGRELLHAIQRIEDAGGELGAVYHSHTRSAPYPSQTDITFAANWPGVEWIIVGLAGGEEPEVRSYLIDGGAVSEVDLDGPAAPSGRRPDGGEG